MKNMKRFNFQLGIILLMLLVCNVGMAEQKEPNKKMVEEEKNNWRKTDKVKEKKQEVTQFINMNQAKVTGGEVGMQELSNRGVE